MTLEPKIALRLQFLARVVRKECQHLTATDRRLFESLFTLKQATLLEANHDLAERGKPLPAGLAACKIPWATNCYPCSWKHWVKKHLPPSTILTVRNDWVCSNPLMNG